jgi:cytochrome c oxidase subunit 3
MKQRFVQDMHALPNHAYGQRMTTWWGTLAFMALEGTGFALAAGAYLYIWWLNPEWPLSAPPPDLMWSSILTVLLVASLLPNWITMKIAKTEDAAQVRPWIVAMSVVGLAALVLRAFEFQTLNVRWDDNAYGSLVWILLGLHTAHILTDVIDTWVLAALMFTKHARGKRFSDVEDNGLYWCFVVVTWVLLYLLLYWGPRL